MRPKRRSFPLRLSHPWRRSPAPACMHVECARTCTLQQVQGRPHHLYITYTSPIHVAAGSRQATSQVQGRPHHRFKAGHITNAYRFKAGSRQATSPDHAISPHTLCIRSRALPVPVQTPHRHDPPCARADPPPKGGAGGSLHHGADRAQF